MGARGDARSAGRKVLRRATAVCVHLSRRALQQRSRADASPVREELIFVGGAHALFVARLFVARQTARRQRAIDHSRRSSELTTPR